MREIAYNRGLDVATMVIKKDAPIAHLSNECNSRKKTSNKKKLNSISTKFLQIQHP